METSTMVLTTDALWQVLQDVLDPEVPALSVVDLGIVRDVAIEGDDVVVTVTPTYSGCPATQVIEQDIMRALREAGVARPRVRTTFSPAWSSDLISPAGRRKLREYGIAPPGPARLQDDSLLVPLVQLTRRVPDVVECPYCDSPATTMRSEFGSTACKAIYFCNACQQPFELFKPI
jgi:ring-1,2-phenylacetyl-CoA epoxidase subunit PaaD